MTTDQMILVLVERHGFKLPEGLEELSERGGGPVVRKIFPTIGGGWSSRYLPNPQIYDLCAMEFARQACRNGTWNYELSAAMVAGDSAAAIKALYDAMESR